MNGSLLKSFIIYETTRRAPASPLGQQLLGLELIWSIVLSLKLSSTLLVLKAISSWEALTQAQEEVYLDYMIIWIWINLKCDSNYYRTSKGDIVDKKEKDSI